MQIKLKQGLAANINATDTKRLATIGEPHWTTDSKQLYVFDGTQNLQVPTFDSNGIYSHGAFQINAPTEFNEALILKTTDDNTTKNLFEAFKADGTTYLASLTADGKFGIGTGSPQSGLHYQGDILYLTPAAGAESNDNITIKDYATGNGAPNIILKTADISGAYGIGVGTLSLIGGSKTTHYGGIDGGGGKISLQGGQGRNAANNPSGYGPVLLQSTGGNVGIGTTEPGRNVEIYGSSSILRLRDSGATANATLAYIEFGGTDAAVWSRTGYIGDTSSGNVDIAVRAEVGDLHLGDSSGGNVMNLQSGNVGIGMTAPGAKLEILSTTDPQLRLTHTDGVDETDFYTNSDGELEIMPTARTIYLGDGTAGDSTFGFYGSASVYTLIHDESEGDLKLSANDGSNYIKFEADGTLEMVGTATVFSDLQFPISFAKVPSSNAPTWETFTANTNEYGFAVDDYIDTQANETPHSWKHGTTGHVHMHITTKAANATGSNRFAKFTVLVAYCDTGEDWQEASFTAELTIPTGTSALQMFYLDMGDLDLTNFVEEAEIKLRVTRIGATGGTEYLGNIFITQVGIHLLEDTLGSRDELSK